MACSSAVAPTDLNLKAEFVSKCNAFNVLPKVINGQVVLYHSRASSCNCPEPGVKPCPLQVSFTLLQKMANSLLQLQLRTTTAGVPLFMSYLEADRSLPIPLLPNDITSEIVLVGVLIRTFSGDTERQRSTPMTTTPHSAVPRWLTQVFSGGSSPLFIGTAST